MSHSGMRVADGKKEDGQGIVKSSPSLAVPAVVLSRFLDAALLSNQVENLSGSDSRSPIRDTLSVPTWTHARRTSVSRNKTAKLCRFFRPALPLRSLRRTYRVSLRNESTAVENVTSRSSCTGDGGAGVFNSGLLMDRGCSSVPRSFPEWKSSETVSRRDAGRARSAPELLLHWMGIKPEYFPAALHR